MKKNYISYLITLIATIFIITGCGENANSDISDTYTDIPMTDTITDTMTAPQTKVPVITPIEPELNTAATIETQPTITPDIDTETFITTTIETETVTYNSFGTTDDILTACSTPAQCETNFDACRVDVNSTHNPYDVIWDYGEAYKEYVKACDWSLVFDTDYYMATFPMLAELYHYDETLLLEHFQTVGIHEGRQGSSTFNFYAFKMNSDCPNYENTYAAYYIDYMLNYDSYQNVNTVYLINDETYLQYDFVLTATQKQELEWVNKYRQEANVNNIYIYSELCNFANLRGYTNVHDDFYAHEWFEANDFSNAAKYAQILCEHYVCISENCIERSWHDLAGNHIFANDYKASKSHYEAMISTEYVGIGISNVYYNETTHRSCQFDTFIGNIDDTL